MAPAPKRGQGSGRSVAFFVVIDFLLKTPFFQPGVGAFKVELVCCASAAQPKNARAEPINPQGTSQRPRIFPNWTFQLFIDMLL